MLYRFAGALIRAVLVMLLIAAPSLIVPEVPRDTTDVVTLMAMFAGVLVCFEYASAYPCLIEFRDAPPFNRVRFISLALMIVLLSIVYKGQTEPTTLTEFIEILGRKVSQSFDFRYSPVNQVTLILPPGTSPELVSLVKTAAGLSYLVSLVTLAVFVLLMRVLHWPAGDGAFNVWVNLPTFDPTSGGDVVQRLRRDGRLNIVLGFSVPFLIPEVVRTTGLVFGAVDLGSSQTLIWTMTAWAFLPASLFMRGIAMGRIADMIAKKRRMNTLGDDSTLQPA